MKITVIGTGYVGLVTGTCLAETGNQVTCIDIDQKKIDLLNQGKITIYEPGLDTIFNRNLHQKRLVFTNNLAEGVKDSKVIFLALPTPPGKDGAADLQYVLQVANEIGALLENYTVIVDKSTVPVGTAEKVRKQIATKTNIPFDVVSNPEFLKEGVAVNDFMKPERVIIGASSEKARKIMQRLYEPLVRQNNQIIHMDEKSAELTKYAANAFLATKITFMNEIANLCEKLGADVESVRKGIGTDSRIGNKFLLAGIGYGGSCFPKDVRALGKAAEAVAYDFKILKVVEAVNNAQKVKLVDKIKYHFQNDLAGKTVALWGLAFKPNTDDIREAPAIYIIKELVKEGVIIKAYDPEAMNNIKALLKEECKGNLTLCSNEYEAVDHADALMIVTEWPEFKNPETTLLKRALNNPVIFDGRNVLDPETMAEEEFTYYSIGRRDINDTVKKKINHVFQDV